MLQTKIKTPLGALSVSIENGALCSATYRPLTERRASASRLDTEALQLITLSLQRYFDGDSNALAKVKLNPTGTEFEHRVWEALRAIPAGQTRCYSDLAENLELPRGARAVGNACGRNPILLFIPCHRVIARDGSLGGFSAGLPLKQRLLELEGFYPAGSTHPCQQLALAV